MKYFVTISLLLLVKGQVIFALEAIHSPSILPTPRFASGAIYDGKDSIYIIGGYQGGYNTTIGEIVRFNISNEEVQVAARLSNNELRSHGSAVYNRDDDIIYYFGGTDYSDVGQRNYWAIDIKQGNMSLTPLINVWAYNGNTAIWDNMTQSAYLFGTQNPWEGSQVVQFSQSTAAFTNLLPFNPPQVLTFDFAITVWDAANRTAYILGGSSIIDGDVAYDRIFKWTASTGQLDLLPIRLPYEVLWTSGVWDSRSNCAYLTGTGYFEWEGGNNVLRFCPSTNEITTFAVDNFPTNSAEMASVYVEKLNRIYIFGGYIDDSIPSDGILYIDL